ncbi:MAG: TatD family hydrolase [Sphingomonas sp.]|uniref:Qat anti-phage system TatD family nuclease QatD n=1 Tax=Sphingomonas sp. TaxID=28214 RepID=UPI002605D832|nr:Qat anti-phage system TatD family nuclease QatD [Sphingomonas sp.]MDK2770230.1 TatD family hydrolase [Sphingomonas sp.]
MIDFHCHIDLYPNAKAIIEEADARGSYILAVTTTPKAWTGTKQLIGDRKRIRVALGLHPELVPDRHAEVPLLEHYLPESRYVGEIGLDGGSHMRGSFELQERVLARILKACEADGKKIISLHSRRAANGVIDALLDAPRAGIPILHWFSGSVVELDRAISAGCWFSVGPVMLNSAKGRRLVELMPADRVLTETDAPFAQIQGKSLMPWDVQLAHSHLAKIWNQSEQEVVGQLKRNLKTLLAD